MQSNVQPLDFWSDSLALALVSSIASETLLQLAADHLQTTPPTGHGLANWLQSESGRCGPLQLAIMSAWREANSHVVAAAEMISIDGSAEQCEALLREFSAEEVLLELITAPDGGGWELTEWIVDNAKNEATRRNLDAILAHWKEKYDPARELETPSRTTPTVRIAVFGGHIRDANKMDKRLFSGSAFDMRWNPFEKGSCIPTAKAINDAIASADAVLLVTTMVSHNIMRMVKRLARDHRIPFRAIPKATDAHLTAAIQELFPEQSCFTR